MDHPRRSRGSEHDRPPTVDHAAAGRPVADEPGGRWPLPRPARPRLVRSGFADPGPPAGCSPIRRWGCGIAEHQRARTPSCGRGAVHASAGPPTRTRRCAGWPSCRQPGRAGDRPGCGRAASYRSRLLGVLGASAALAEQLAGQPAERCCCAPATTGRGRSSGRPDRGGGGADPTVRSPDRGRRPA